ARGYIRPPPRLTAARAQSTRTRADRREAWAGPAVGARPARCAMPSLLLCSRHERISNAMPSADPSPISLTSILVSTVLAVGAVMASAMLGRGAVHVFRIKQAEQRIVVTGSATKRIQSDFVVWRAVVKSQAPEMALAYKKLSVDVPAVSAFVQSKG